MTAYPDPDSEEALENDTMELFKSLDWDEAVNCYDEKFGIDGTLGRETSADVILVPRLREALRTLNPDIPSDAIEQAIDEILRDRSRMTPANANRDVYRLLKDGIKVKFSNRDNEEVIDTVQVIDWNNCHKNDFFLASQFWISGEMYKRRADLIGFINGIPLVFIELKASHKRLENAYNDNLRDYKNTIPQIFWYTGFIILSNGKQSKIGTLTTPWEHFSEWKKINSEGEKGIISLDTIIRGTCEPSRLLDILENFILYSEESSGIVKFIAKNHQYIGVNNAIESLKNVEINKGRLGVFWHTQGSGKSYSMVFFAQKALRKFHGSHTFLVVTDREELDNQIYANFAKTGVVTEEHTQAVDGEHLRLLLREDHRYIFTLIQKFKTPETGSFPLLSERSDIIIIADEAHRSQYETLAANMRKALPNAAFIAFTGTPLIVGEEKTKKEFGDYVSVYNFKQSVDDGATVPLYYENRIPELQLTNDAFDEDMHRIIEEAELDENQEKKFEREISRQYHLITRDERLETIAKDMVSHFMERGYLGKSMFIAIDKATAVKMYDKVRKYWNEYLEDLKVQYATATKSDKDIPGDKIIFMQDTDMAVVVSQSQNEVEDLKKKGVDIRPHRERMVREDLETKFKDSKDNFRIVFVCAMWITGFDVPTCSTIYLDKPMKNHTLMQTIARANRVYSDKTSGLIVDYVGMFRSLQKALAIYGSDSGGGVKPGDYPVIDKEELVEKLEEIINEIISFCRSLGIDIEKVLSSSGFERVKLRSDAVEAILVDEETKKEYLSMALIIHKLFKAILPDPAADELAPKIRLFDKIAEEIRSLETPADISRVMEKVEKLLDRSIASEGYLIKNHPSSKLINLNEIDFEVLRNKFNQGRKRTELEKLKAILESKLKQMILLNKTRIDYLETYQKMIAEYNAGSRNVEDLFNDLIELVKKLSEEEQRHIAENLTEEELSIFDLLTKPDMHLTKKEEQQVKEVVKELLTTLTHEKLVLDWKKKQQARAEVKTTVEDILDHLPEKYSAEVYQQKCEIVFGHIYDSYYGAGQGIYA